MESKQSLKGCILASFLFLKNSSLSVRCAATNVGAVINRPAVKCCDSTSVFGEFVTSYCRADDIRPYGIIFNSPINWNFAGEHSSPLRQNRYRAKIIG